MRFVLGAYIKSVRALDLYRGATIVFQRSVFPGRKGCQCRRKEVFSERSGREPPENVMLDFTTLPCRRRDNER